MEQPKKPSASSPPNGEAQAEPAPAEDAPSEIKHETPETQPGELTPEQMKAIQAAVTTPAPPDSGTVLKLPVDYTSAANRIPIKFG